MFQRILLYLFLLISHQQLFSQNYIFRKKIPVNEHIQFLGLTKKTFEITKNFAYNVSFNDSKAKIEDISVTVYNNDYLTRIQKRLAKDSLDPIALNDFGNYHNSKGNKSLAKVYFTKSFNNWNLKSGTKKDSAFYYSFRSLLKSNLDKENAIDDLDKALTINPKDSIALLFYPMLLIKNKDFAKSKKICLSALEEKSENPEIPYTILCFGILFEQMEILSDESKKAENAKKNYDELFDYKTLTKYAELYKDNPKIQYLKKMYHIFGLSFKLYLFEQDNNDGVIINYNAYDIAKMKQLESDFKEALTKNNLNPFTANKSLAALHFFLKNNDKAIEYAKKAIAAFPDSKRGSEFNPDETYSLLLMLYQLKNDDRNFKNTLEEKIKKAADDEKSITDFLYMAYLHLYKNEFDASSAWCAKAREIDPDNFDAIALFAHLKFMENGINNNITGQFYLDQAQSKMKDDSDFFNFGLQTSIYMILSNQPENAKKVFQNIEICKKANPKQTVFCDKLIDEYIQINP